MVKEKILGIDLGTSNSAAAVLEAGKPKMIPSAEGTSLYGKSFPSVVAFTKDNQLLVGEPAKRQAVSNPEGTIMAAKRKIGTNFVYKIYGKQYTPQQISAFILQKVKKDAEAFLGEKIKKAVITVPAYFDDAQRQATKDAGAIAGLDVVRIINEPTAAAFAYGLDKEKEQRILIFDFGGGTLDVTIMEFGDGTFEVKSTSGDTHLGGTDMDNSLINYCIKKFKEENGIDLSEDATAMQRIREAAEKAKIELSTVIETEINLPFITATDKGPKHLLIKLSRAKLEELVEPIIKKCKKPVEQALSDAKLSPNHINKVILVGGPTRMPIVQKFVEDIFGKKVERGVDPMECVAMGAAIQGGILAGELKDILLLDVTPLSLGIETMGGIFTKIIDKNTTIPVKRSQIFSTASDNQPAVSIRVLQGERPMASDNKLLGCFDLVGIPPAPRGIPQIEVTFDIDANGIVHVSAKDLGTGKEQKIVITGSTNLSKEEIEKMKKQAEEFAEQDRKRKDFVELKNQADSTIFATRKVLEDYKDKIDTSLKSEIEQELKELETIAKTEDIEDSYKIKEKLDALNKKLQDIGTRIYGEYAKHQASQQQENKSQQNNQSTDTNDEDDKNLDKDYQDAEFKVKK